MAVEGSEFDVELDTLVVAISEHPETAGLDGVRLTPWGTVAINPESYVTDRPGVFAGGDVVSGPSTAIAAIAAGRHAAAMIDRYVTGKVMKVLPKMKLPSVYVEPLAPIEEEPGELVRLRTPLLPVLERAGCFAEVELCPTEQATRIEARRCLRCDLDFTQPR